MADIFWENDNDLPALDLFDPTNALPALDDGFAMSPLHFHEQQLEVAPDPLPVTLPSVNLAPKDEPASFSDDLLSIPTPPDNPSPVGGGSVDDEFFSQRGFSGSSSQNHEELPPTTSLSSTASDLTTSLSAVELAKRKAEQYANDKASDRKRKSSSKNSNGNAKRQKGTDGSSCSDGEDEDDAPEKVSHRKYQKRLQKNRDSAYVSRIRRREYARCLEEGLERTEKEKNELARSYEDLKRRFDVAMQELKTLKEATAARFNSVANSISTPIGAASMATSKPKKAGAIVTTMFMFALMFGVMLPESLTSKPASLSNLNGAGSHVGTNYPTYGPLHLKSAASADAWNKNGRVWGAAGPPLWKPTRNQALLEALSSNVTQLFGKEHAGRMMQIMEQRLEEGVVSEKALLEIADKAQVLVDNIGEETVQEAVQSRKAAMFQTILRRLAAAADDCFTKELVALLTVRLIPQPSKHGIRT